MPRIIAMATAKRGRSPRRVGPTGEPNEGARGPARRPWSRPAWREAERRAHLVQRKSVARAKVPDERPQNTLEQERLVERGQEREQRREEKQSAGAWPDPRRRGTQVDTAESPAARKVHRLHHAKRVRRVLRGHERGDRLGIVARRALAALGPQRHVEVVLDGPGTPEEQSPPKVGAQDQHRPQREHARGQHPFRSAGQRGSEEGERRLPQPEQRDPHRQERPPVAIREHANALQVGQQNRARRRQDDFQRQRADGRQVPPRSAEPIGPAQPQRAHRARHAQTACGEEGRDQGPNQKMHDRHLARGTRKRPARRLGFRRFGLAPLANRRHQVEQGAQQIRHAKRDAAHAARSRAAQPSATTSPTADSAATEPAAAHNKPARQHRE
jgi:hypothetical protein